ncbi:MAG TPA: hypothetical protein VJH03_08010 [Blastocatellia bacterium]|nr:hypothetical protein [Blastocatellia bacterium]
MSDVDWAALIAEEDVERLWNGLYQLVSRHPAVRPLRFATDGAAVTSAVEINADLTQELFLELFQKQRFEHYVDNAYTSAEIENELTRIELPNLVGARLRRRYPESFRMARRVSSLLKTSALFRRFDGEHQSDSANGKPRARRGRPPKRSSAADAASQTEDHELETLEGLYDPEDDASTEEAAPQKETRRRRMVDQLFGLREWPRRKAVRDSGHFTERVKSVAMRRRDTRIVGRSGTSQLILSNPELEKLIVDVFRAIDSPADVRTVRQLVLSKIPIQDYNVASLDEEFDAGTSRTTLRHTPHDTRDTPEDALLREEHGEGVAGMAHEFLTRLRRAVNNNERRFARLITTLWHFYFSPAGLSQLEIAELLGVSDSLVSDNRRLIETELKKLDLSLEDGAIFAEALKQVIVEEHLTPEGASRLA